MYVYRNRLVFIAHPRTASRSVAKALPGAVLWGKHHEVNEDKVQNILDNGGTVVSNVRNMYDILVSWFHRAHRGDPPTNFVPVKEFTNWLTKVLGGGHQYLDQDPYHFGYGASNFVIPYEQLGSMFEVLCRLEDIKGANLPHVGVSNRYRDYRRYYTDTTRQMVEDRWGREQEQLGYSY